MYGYRSSLLNDQPEAITYYEKELKLHPDEIQIYGVISEAQNMLGKRKEAEDSLRTRLAKGAADEKVSLRLASYLLDDGDAVAAIPVLQAASTNQPDHVMVQILLSHARIKAGKVSDGIAPLKPIIEKSDDPEVLNAAAYELADANVDLDLSNLTVQKALHRLESNTASMSIEGDAQAAKSSTSLIIATWDTQGWVLFRQHKIDEGEPYVRAAWLQQPSTRLACI